MASAPELLGEGFDLAGAFFDPTREPSVFSKSHKSSASHQDEAQLLAAVRAERRREEAGKPSRDAIKQVASVILQSGQGGPSFAERVGKLLRQTHVEVPQVTVEYQGLTVEADALLGSAGNPSVGNAFRSVAKQALLQGGLSTQPYQILKGIDGILKPGRMTLLLGPPGSGKSVFMQALAGRLRPSKHLRISGSIKYNGVPPEDFVVRRTIGMVEQYDYHIPNQSVLQTVEFAGQCQTSRRQVAETLAAMDVVAHRLGRSKEASRAAAEEHMEEGKGRSLAGDAETSSPPVGVAREPFDDELYRAIREVASYKFKPFLILRMLGLDHVADTMVGNDVLRGVSGGQRKRVTTAEILAGPQSAVLFDQISTGLDSATTFSVIKTLGEACHALQRTFLICLLQPPPEVFHLFDDVLLLTDGQVLYHGPVAEVLPHIGSIGFACPVRKDPASFLQEVTTPLGQILYAKPELLDAHGLPPETQDATKLLGAPPNDLLVGVPEIAEAFWMHSERGRQMMDELRNQPFDSAKGSPNALVKEKFANGWAYLSAVVLQRQIALNKSMKGYFIARIIQTVVMGLIIGSLFWDIQPTVEQGRNVLSVCTLGVMYLAFMSGPQLGMVFSTKRVFYNQRDNNFFPSTSYDAGLLLTQIPQSTIEAVIFSSLTYWMCNFEPSAGCFFTYLLVMWSVSNSLAGLFRLFAYASPTMVLAQSVASLLLLLLMLTNGFSIVLTSMKWYIRWIYYINPLAWGMKAIIINELTSTRWSGPVNGSELTVGETSLDMFGMPSERFWIWAGVGFEWVALLAFSFTGTLALKYMDPPSPRPTVTVEEQKKELARGVKSAIFRRSMVAVAKHPADNSNEPSPSDSPTGKADAPTVPFVPITVVCRDIRYYVTDPSGGTAPGVVREQGDKEIAGKLELLKGISIYTKPGQLSALMGGSGAGKTTLMDVICGRKTQGVIRGEILVNGHPKDQATWSRIVGYVEQSDIISSRTTVKEALLFSARLRLVEEKVSMDQVKALVEETLKTVELTALQHSIVGEPGGVGLSIEQRKRLNIAIELVANPSIVFLDEPTSGLDARAAAIVMRAVRNVTRTNRTILTTIHQPSMEIFETFDTLVLLQPGGRLTYFGPLGLESSDLIRYLEAYPGVEPIKPGYNPATWMLEVTGGSMATMFASTDSDFPALYAASELKKDNDAVMAALAEEKGSAPLELASRYATKPLTQYKWLVRKFTGIYWHSPEYNFVRLLVTTAVALFYGLTYLNQGSLDENGVTVATVQNIMGLTFSLAIFLGMLNCMTSMPIMSAERVVFYRERAASMYSPWWYSLAIAMAEAPYIITQSVLMVCISYWMVGFQAIAWKFFFFLLLYYLTLTMYTCLGQFLTYLTPSDLLGQLLAAVFSQLWSYFNGFLIPYPSIPAGWKWMNRISPTTWILYGLAGSQLTDRSIPMESLDGSKTTVSAFMADYFGYENRMIWWCVLIAAAYVIFFRVGSVLLLRYVNYERR